MRNFKKMLQCALFALLLLTFGAPAQGQSSFVAEKQRELMSFLTEEGYYPYIESSDQSVRFKKEGVLYWLTVMENQFMIVFDRVGYRTTGENAFLPVPTLKAANKVNVELDVAKIYCTNTKAVVEIVVRPETLEDFKYIFYTCMRQLDAADKLFKKYYYEFEKE